MILQEPKYIEEMSNELWFKNFQIEVVLELIFEGATVPFIARYRKERTWNLDENHIRNIIEIRNKIEKLYKIKKTAIKGIEELWKMTSELMNNILKAKTLKEVEEIYKPYKSKKKTKAMIAIEKWFQVIADMIKKNIDLLKKDTELVSEKLILKDLLNNYSIQEIFKWCTHIISTEISANADLRSEMIKILQKNWTIVSRKKTEKALLKLNEKDKWQIHKFNIYSDFSLKLKHLKPYQILALNRWERIWILWVKIEKTEEIYETIRFYYAKLLDIKLPFIDILEESFKDWYITLFKSVEKELRSILNEDGEDDAIETFKQNLANLLMTKPEYGKKILVIDPWYRAGCKMTILDNLWKPIKFDKIFLNDINKSKLKLKQILSKENPNLIVVWNWTWVNETIEILQKVTNKEIYIVNESWASVYSASKIAAEEFPDLDSLDRWTVSIWRRYIDPLSELVKVPVGSIGVWMYQHDISEKKLEKKLWDVVENVVNEVWINVNSASSYVLNYISWINKKVAKKIYNNRPYKSRIDLKKQLSSKVYEQAVWFLRVPDSKEELDNTDIHPEQYKLTKYMLKNDIWPDDFESNKSILTKIYPDVKITTLDFIVESYNNLWKEKRINSTHKKVTKKIILIILKSEIFLNELLGMLLLFERL